MKINAFLKNNVTSLGRLPSFLDFFGLLLRIFIKILILRKIYKFSIKICSKLPKKI